MLFRSDDGHAQHADAVVPCAQDALTLAYVENVGISGDLELI